MRLDRDLGPLQNDVAEGHPEMTPLLGQGEAALVEASAGWLDPATRMDHPAMARGHCIPSRLRRGVGVVHGCPYA